MKRLITNMLIVLAVFAVIGCDRSKTASEKLNNASVEEIIGAQLNRESPLDIESNVKLLNHSLLQSSSMPQLIYRDSLDNFVIAGVKYPDKEDEAQYDLYTLSFCILGGDTLVVNGIQHPASDLINIMQFSFREIQDGIYPVKQRNDSLSTIGRIETPEIILHVTINIKKNNGVSTRDMNLLLEIVNMYASLMDKNRANAVQNYLGCPFDQLNETDKTVFRRLYSKIIAISFDQPCSYIPRPNPDTLDIEL